MSKKNCGDPFGCAATEFNRYPASWMQGCQGGVRLPPVHKTCLHRCSPCALHLAAVATFPDTLLRIRKIYS
jgi:hypothetical protein